MSKIENNMSLTAEAPAKLSTTQRLASGIGLVGLLILVLAVANVNFPDKTLLVSKLVKTMHFSASRFSF